MGDATALASALEEQLRRDRECVWTQSQAIELCCLIEEIAPQYGAHVALTGGTLYKADKRKNADILFYRIRQVSSIDEAGLLAALAVELDIEIGSRFGWVVKASYRNKPVDLFFPDSDLSKEQAEYDRSKESGETISAIPVLNLDEIDKFQQTITDIKTWIGQQMHNTDWHLRKIQDHAWDSINTVSAPGNPDFLSRTLGKDKMTS